MTMYLYCRQWWVRSMVACWVVLATCSLCPGAPSFFNELGVMGKYFAEDPSPDDLTTTQQGHTLRVTYGSALPDRFVDIGVVRLKSKSGPKAVFFGRSTGWGCGYTVNGVYVWGAAPGRSQGVFTGPEWTKQFVEVNTPRIVLEINTASTGDDLVGLGVLWTEMEVRLLDGVSGTTYHVSNFFATNPGGVDLSNMGDLFLTTDLPAWGGFLRGTVEGMVAISANCDNNATVVPTLATVVKPIKTPNGDPTTTAGANATNERTFSVVATGVATVSCEAERVVMDPGDFRWTIDNAGATQATWGGGNTGTGLSPTATYTGLPADNDDFGEKTITLTDPAIDSDQVTQVVELFFPRDATNHPGAQAGDPNWFYYWSQVYVNNDVHYVAGLGPRGQTPGMRNWLYNTAPDKTRIAIGNRALGKYRSYTVGTEFSGIDRFIAIVIHEEKHVDQIARADALMPASNGSDSFRYGWSWGQTTHNHWNKGTDGEWGVAGNDDDGNGIMDDAAPLPPFEPGMGPLFADVSLEYIGVGIYRDWPAAWVVPPGFPGNTGMFKIEVEAVRAEDVMAENDYARQDWADRGKNHRTLDNWDD